MFVVSFLRSIINELKLVDWISFPESAKLTVIVLVISIIIGIIIVALDLLFLGARSFLLDM